MSSVDRSESSTASIDGRGRLQIASALWGDHRNLRPDGSSFTNMTVNHRNQLVLFRSDAELERIAARLARLQRDANPSKVISDEDITFYLNYPRICREIDSRGRIYLPQEYRDRVGIQGVAKVTTSLDCIVVENPSSAQKRYDRIHRELGGSKEGI
jgi:DNA-binding transcriptional regulator/RsmH inhibitor MraZ